MLVKGATGLTGLTYEVLRDATGYLECLTCLVSIVSADGLTTIDWISNYIHYKMWDEIAYPFLKFNSNICS